MRCAIVACGLSVTPVALSAAVLSGAPASLPPVQLSPDNSVPECVTPARLMAFLKARNPTLAPRYTEIAGHYATYGERIGVRWDIGFLQMMLETENLTFQGPGGAPGDVKAEHNNFAGIGAVGDGQPGEIFATQIQGVRAHLEHVLHYSGVILPAPVAERTRKVQAWQVLHTWHKSFRRPVTYSDLAARWAAHSISYRVQLEHLATTFQNQYCDGREVMMAGPKPRPPSIAETAWRFEKAEGAPGTAGTIPPTGRPELARNRDTLGAGRAVMAARISPPVPTLQRQAPITRPVDWPKNRHVTRAAPVAREDERGAGRVHARAQPGAGAPSVRQGGHAEPRRPAAAVSPEISADVRIRQMISDRKILLRTHVGTIIPIQFGGNGEMHGQAGSLAFFLGASQDKGRWWVANGKLCQKWRVWLDRDTYCMTLKERGGTIWWQADDGKSGTARIVQN